MDAHLQQARRSGRVLWERARTSTTAAVLVGTSVGLSVVAVYLISGLLVADWYVGDFLAHVSPGMLGYFVGMIALAVTVVGAPIAAFLRFDLTAPLAVLVLVVLSWLAIGISQQILTVETVFGVALYAVLLGPFYLVLYGVLGVMEYLLRGEQSSS